MREKSFQVHDDEEKKFGKKIHVCKFWRAFILCVKKAKLFTKSQ